MAPPTFDLALARIDLRNARDDGGQKNLVASDSVSPSTMIESPSSTFSIVVDELLLRRARNGDLEALERLFRTFQTPVHNLARRVCRNAHDADDILQETFLEVVRSIGRFRGEGSFAGWVRRIAASKALMRLRERRHEELPEELPAADRQSDQTQHPATLADLEATLARLSDAARAVVWLHEVEGYNHEEIGAMMGKTASFSKSQLARAWTRLRELDLRQIGGSPCT
jgi:RNA polymerase sigma-70 factor (ECF subfamily)